MIDQKLFNHCYARVEEATRQSLQDFHARYEPRFSEHDGIAWHYVALGQGVDPVVFLSGAIGTYYIWWQQLLALGASFRTISISYPPEPSLAGLHAGLETILAREGIDRFHIVGSSMGGYLAQYIASKQPDRLLSATFANTFVPTKTFLPAAPLLRLAIHLLPLSWIHSIFRVVSRYRLVPTGGHSALLEAYLMEMSYIGLSKTDALARINVVNQRFEPPLVTDLPFPILIIDSNNDPLIRPSARRAMHDLYPSTHRLTLEASGHFPYLSRPERYTDILFEFLNGK